MTKQKILNTREVKDVLKQIKERWGADFSKKYVFLMNEKNKVYITNRDIAKIPMEKIRLNTAGLYIAEINEKYGIRLSIEGSQLIGPSAKKNILELDDNQARLWLKGQDLEIEHDLKNFPIIKNKDNYLGCGKAVKGKILNYVSKTRRIHASD